MAATTVERNTPALYIERQTKVPLAATTKVPNGALVAQVGASGLATNAANTAGLRVVGRAEHTGDSNVGFADTDIVVGRGVFGWAASSALIALGQAACGKRVYVVDNQTVGIRNEAACSNGVCAGVLDEIDGAVFYVDSMRADEAATGSDLATVADAAVSPAIAALGAKLCIPILFPDAATADYDYVVPDKVEIIDITIIKDVAGAANTLQAKNGAGTAISDAMAFAVDKTCTRCATLDKATRVLAALAVLRFTNTRAAGSSAGAAFVEVIKRA